MQKSLVVQKNNLSTKTNKHSITHNQQRNKKHGDQKLISPRLPNKQAQNTNKIHYNNPSKHKYKQKKKGKKKAKNKKVLSTSSPLPLTPTDEIGKNEPTTPTKEDENICGICRYDMPNNKDEIGIIECCNHSFWYVSSIS